jgi:hypothetical protein
MERQLETHMTTVVSQEMRRRSSAAILAKETDENKTMNTKEDEIGTIKVGEKKGSSSSEEGFVKIRATVTDEGKLKFCGFSNRSIKFYGIELMNNE